MNPNFWMREPVKLYTHISFRNVKLVQNSESIKPVVDGEVFNFKYSRSHTQIAPLNPFRNTP